MPSPVEEFGRATQAMDVPVMHSEPLAREEDMKRIAVLKDSANAGARAFGYFYLASPEVGGTTTDEPFAQSPSNAGCHQVPK